MGRRRQQRQGGEQITRRRGQVGDRRGEHLAKDFAFGPSEAFAHPLDRLAAAQLADRPAGQQRVARGGGQWAGARGWPLQRARPTDRRFDGLGQRAAHLGGTLAFGFGEQ